MRMIYTTKGQKRFSNREKINCYTSVIIHTETKHSLYFLFKAYMKILSKYCNCQTHIISKSEVLLMFEYYPWSKKVLHQCLNEFKNGGIPTIDLELTAKCSGACCIYCDSKPGVCSNGLSNELAFDILENAILEGKKRGLKWVYTCGLGEPMEDSKFWKLVSLLHENHISLSMFSNGVFIKDIETARRLKENDVYIILKMDTFEEEKFDLILGKPGTARKIYKARDLLLDAGYGLDDNGYTNLAFSIVPTSLSVDGIPDVISFCKKKGIFASIGELEQAGEVINNNLENLLGLSTEQVLFLKQVADEYYDGSYMRPICPCILTGIHIDNFGNCIVDTDTGLNCKWFLLKNPQVTIIGNLNQDDLCLLQERASGYRKTVFSEHKSTIKKSCDISYIFGGCGGNPKDIFDLACQEMIL